MKLYKRVFLFLLSTASVALYADLFPESRNLRQIETEHFTFIFAEESRSTAGYLASRAEEIYADVADTLNAPMNLHLPVVMTPDTDQLNGFFSSAPLLMIALYESPLLPNSGFALYNDNLEKLFMHELTHAVSLSQRTPFFDFWAAIFGDVVVPASYFSTPTMIEGVTVSFESRDGYGRAADTPYASIIQQDILENKFRTFHESAGINTGYPGGLWYVYGGWFSRFLIETYGADSYAALWKGFADAELIEDGLLTIGAFRSVYGMSLEDAWEDFRRWMQIKTPVVSEVLPLDDQSYTINSIEVLDGKLYWADARKLYRYDPDTRQTEALTNLDGTVDRIAADPENGRLLVSLMESAEEGMSTAILREYDPSSNRWNRLDNSEGLMEAVRLSDGSLVAVRADGYAGDLILMENGETRVLLEGTETILPSQPCRWGRNSLLFLLKVDGKTMPVLYNRTTDSFSTLVTEEPVQGIRHLWTDGESACFIYDNDLSLFKLGRLTGNDLRVQSVPLSGGIQFPVALNGSIYYNGRFSRRQQMLRYPADNPALKLNTVEHRWESLPGEILERRNLLDEPASFEDTPYSPIGWLLIPQIRYPLMNLDIYLSTGNTLIGGEGLRSLGIGGYSKDPTMTYALEWEFDYHIEAPFVGIDLSWTSSSLPFDYSIRGYHKRVYDNLNSDYLRLGTALHLEDSKAFFPNYRQLFWALDASYETRADENPLKGPYSWNYDTGGIGLGAFFQYASVQTEIYAPRNRSGYFTALGYSGYADLADSWIPDGFFSADGGLYLPFLGFSSIMHASVSTGPGVVFTSTGPRTAEGALFSGLGYTPPISEAWSNRSNLSGSTYLYADTSFNFEWLTETPLLGNFYLESIDLQAGYRCAWLANNWLDSWYLRSTMDVYIDLGRLASVPWEIGTELEFDPGAGAESGWRLSLVFMGASL